ncbi:MAG: hypothetical protein P8X74_03755 [Reinekea sp.]
MHTTRTEKTIFQHNGDYSGDVIIMEKETNKEVKVPFDDLKAFFAEYVRENLISRVENMDERELLHVF